MPVGPAATGFIQLLLLVVMVFAIFWIGRAMGGSGSFEEAILLVAWLQFIMVCLQVVQAFALVFLPPSPGSSASRARALSVASHELHAVLHGFTSLFRSS
jgi:hypothetical protein